MSAFLAAHTPGSEAPATPPTETTDNPRAKGDSELAVLYGRALRGITGVSSHDKQIMVDNIPADSTFGQWWSQLSAAFQSPDVLEWMRREGVNPQTIKIAPGSGQITFEYQRFVGKPGIQVRGPDNTLWAQVSGTVLDAANIVTTNSKFASFKPPVVQDSRSAPLWLVTRFYREQEQLSPAQIEQRATELERDKAFAELDPTHFSGLLELRSEEALAHQKSILSNIHTLRAASTRLLHLSSQLESGALSNEDIADYLATTRTIVHTDSSFRKVGLNKWSEQSLENFLKENGWDIPTTHEQVANLQKALGRPEVKSPLHGNYGGALAWPEPLDSTSQLQLRADIRHGSIGEIDLRPSKNVLEYLLQYTPVDPTQLRNPRRLLDVLLQSPKALALGEAIRVKFEARSILGSATDWLLAALSVDQADPVRPIKGRPRDWAAGFALSGPASYGKTAPEIMKAFAEHLVLTGGASSSEKAMIRAYVLLSSRAPEFLVKDIPDSVTFGSHAWVSFVTAVERIEAKAPGATALMSYGQVMLEADITPVTPQERHVEYTAQQQALKSWAGPNGMSYPLNEKQMGIVRDAFNAQINELKTAAQAQWVPIPSAKGMALEQLKKALPNKDPAVFEKKCITVFPPDPEFPGPYSVADLLMDGRAARGHAPSGQWVSSSSDVNIAEMLEVIKALPYMPTAFNDAFSTYVQGAKKSIETHVKALIARQTGPIRADLEYGKITVVREMDIEYQVYAGSTKKRASKDNALLVKVVRDGEVRTYEINLSQSRIVERNDLGDFQPGTVPLNSHHPSKDLQEVIPIGEFPAHVTDEKTVDAPTPDSFNSLRTKYIASAFVTDANFAELEAQAQGATQFDTEVPFYEQAQEFMLNMIPLRSAIVNFQNGNIGDGIVDLTMDVFGFVVGAGAAAKVVRGSSTLLGSLARGAKIVGRTALGSLNPLSGADDLARGAWNLGRSGASAARNGLNHLRSALTRIDPVALAKAPGIGQGTLKGVKGADDARVFAKFNDAAGQWHALNLNTRQPYGAPLKNFQPDTVAVSVLRNNADALHKKLGSPAQICYEKSLRIGQAENALPKKTRDAVMNSIDTRGATNYTPRYKELMGMTPENTKAIFDPTEITESGIINFSSNREGARVVHTAYIQKTSDNKLFLYSTNQGALDRTMYEATGKIEVCAGALVSSLDNDGLQNFLDMGYSFVFTPNSTLNSNVQRLLA